jgi:hypothetical protein
LTLVPDDNIPIASAAGLAGVVVCAFNDKIDKHIRVKIDVKMVSFFI